MIWPFFVFSLPRSRSYWLSQWFSYHGLTCNHDIGPTVDTCQQFLDTLWPCIGTCETGLQDTHHLIRDHIPQAKFVIIHRPVDEVALSLARHGISDSDLQRRSEALYQIDGLHLDYDSLTDVRVCAALWDYIMPFPFDFEWWRTLDKQNLQVDVEHMKALLISRQRQIEGLKHEAQTNPSLHRIWWEDFDSTWKDAEQLTLQHSIEVNAGTRHGHPFKLDVKLLRNSEATGLFKVMSARIKGELVGYITWSFLPDPESQGVLIADQGAWFVHPDAPKGIGLKLIQTSIRELKRMGLHSVQLHHQLHGRGSDLGKLFKRLGAIEHQHQYTLWIGDR